MPQSFWEKVCKNDPCKVPESHNHFPRPDVIKTPCWIWIAGITPNGYGQFRHRPAHAVSFELAWGADSVSDGLFVMHRCDYRPCVNQGHLFLGTPGANAKDMAFKKRSTGGERSPNSKLTEKQVASIRARHKTGLVTVKQLALEHGVSTPLISKIVTGKAWANV